MEAPHGVDTQLLLRKVSIFHGLEPGELARLAGSLETVRLAKDATIVGQADQGDALYIIAEGRVKVVLQGQSGGEVILSIFRPGDFFGEMSLLDGQPRSASVVSIEATRLFRLSREAFAQHLVANPATALKVLAEMSSRLRRADEIIGNLVLLDVFSRLARALLELGRQEGENTEEGILIRERPTQQELAAMVGTSRETVSRVLSELQRRGFIAMQGKVLLLSHGFAASQVGDTEREPLP
jgi:CRP/FNR family cyclic AMP-dependent transcriptional regulator